MKLMHVVLLSVILGLGMGSLSRAGVAEEYQVKAAFFYHFARFTKWPSEKFSSDDEPFRVCLIGKNPFQGKLQKVLSGKRVHERAFSLVTDMSESEIGECHIVFIGQDVADRSKEITQALQGKGVLTISESKDFIQQGGMVRLFLDRSKVRFGINPQMAHQAHLEISSKLLRLAKIESP